MTRAPAVVLALLLFTAAMPRMQDLMYAFDLAAWHMTHCVLVAPLHEGA